MPINPPQPATQSQPDEIFPDAPPSVLCSWNECSEGHRWATTAQVVKCPGCQGMTLALKKENCPHCNEPCVRMALRCDHIPRGGGLVARCKGQTSPQSETMDVVLERTAWKDAQDGAKFFNADGA